MADREISTETVAAAERLAAVDYTLAERSQMLGKLDEHVGRARARRAFKPANGLGPAVVFDPPPAGRRAGAERRRLPAIRTGAAAAAGA